MVTVHDLFPLTDPERFTPRGVRLLSAGIERAEAGRPRAVPVAGHRRRLRRERLLAGSAPRGAAGASIRPRPTPSCSRRGAATLRSRAPLRAVGRHRRAAEEPAVAARRLRTARPRRPRPRAGRSGRVERGARPPPPGARRPGPPDRVRVHRRARPRCTPRPRRSPSRACARASACRRSRRWRRAPPSSCPTTRRWSRSSTAPRCVAPIGDADAWAEALAVLVDDAAAAERLGQAARERAGAVHVGALGRASRSTRTRR